MADSFTLESSDSAAPSFSLTSGPHRNSQVSVHLAKGLPPDAWEQVHKNPLFGDWVSFFCHEGRLKINRITIQQIKPEICIDVEATNSNGAAVRGPVVLRPMQASILIVLRNSQTQLELCVFCKRPDLTTGLPESLGLIEGHFDAEGKLGGPCAALLEKHLELTLHRGDCVDLLSAAHGRTVGHAGVLCCSAAAAAAAASGVSAAVRTQLLLYRSTAPPEMLQKLEQEVGRTKRHGFPLATAGSAQQAVDLGLRVVYMGDTWRATLDPRAISALFLLVESRYHQVKLPKPPRMAVQDGKGASHGATRTVEAAGGAPGAPQKKAAAQFSKISSLSPLCSGVNLRVKVVEPIKPRTDLVLPRGQVIKRGTMVVGDDEAIITLNLEAQQLELPDVVNTPLLIRNARIQMEEGHMKLVVDRWGKISDARGDDFKDFNFSVCTARDMSEQEYELVELAGSDADTPDGLEGGSSSSIAQGFSGRGRRGPLMTGRGRAGFRGGRGRRGA